MKKIIDYEITSSRHPEVRNQRVDRLLRRGWQPYGPPYFTTDSLNGVEVYQPMILREGDACEPSAEDLEKEKQQDEINKEIMRSQLDLRRSFVESFSKKKS